MKSVPDVKHTRAILLAKLGVALESYGFPRRSSGYSYRQKTPFGYVAIHLNIAEYHEEFDAAVHASVRHEAAEECANACNDLLTKAERRKTATLGCELGNLMNGCRREWRGISPGSNLDEIVSEMTDLVRSVGLPYFARYSKAHEAYAVLKGGSAEAAASAGALHVAQRAVALAFVIAGIDEARATADAKRDQLRALDARYVTLFDKFMQCFMSQHASDA